MYTDGELDAVCIVWSNYEDGEQHVYFNGDNLKLKGLIFQALFDIAIGTPTIESFDYPRSVDGDED